MMIDVKEGWEVKKLREVCDIKHGYAFEGTDFETNFLGENPIVLTPGNFSENSTLIFNEKNTKRCISNYPKEYEFEEGALVVVMTDLSAKMKILGKAAFIDRNFILHNQRIGKFVFFDNSINRRYLYYFLQTQNYLNWIKDSATGTMVRHTAPKRILDFKIPVPLLPEQQRIVSILDEAFATIAQAKANAEQNLKNAKELFESYLQGVFEGKGWKEKKLGEIAFVKSGGTPSRAKEEYWEGDIPWYSSGELNNLYTVDPERHINDLAINNSNSKLFPKGSLLIGMYDTAALKMSILDREGTFNQAIAGVKPNDKIDLTFVLHSINSIKSDLLNLRRGVRQKNLSLEKIKNIPIFLPSLHEQQAIVQKLDLLSTETKKLETIYQKKIADLEELKKSLLEKAFKGELGAQLPTAKVIDHPAKIVTISAKELQAGIVAFALQRHLEQNKANTFKHVKAEKIVHLAEQVLSIDLDRNPVKDAAGPNDFPHAKRVEFRAQKAGYFYVKKGDNGYEYTAGSNIQSVINKTEVALHAQVDKLTWLVDLLIPMNTQQAEIVATVYAAWNNLLLDKKFVDDEAIVTEARENWHPDKLKIERSKFFNAITWMKSNGLIPKGTGKIVLAKQAK